MKGFKTFIKYGLILELIFSSLFNIPNAVVNNKQNFIFVVKIENYIGCLYFQKKLFAL